MLLFSGLPSSARAGDLADVHALVYSTTAAEVFWRRTHPTDRVEILRNGAIVGLYDASSYSFQNLDATQGHRIQLRALDAHGRVSAPVTLTFGTAGFELPVRQILPDISEVAEPESAPSQRPQDTELSTTTQVSLDDDTAAATSTSLAIACSANSTASLQHCTSLARSGKLPRGDDGRANISIASDIKCGGNCCPGGAPLLNLDNASDIRINGNGHRILRRTNQRSCSLLTLHNASNVTLTDVTLDDDETVDSCTVADRCPRMLWMREARNIEFKQVTVRYSKGYAIYVQGTTGFSFLDSTLEYSGVLGLYIGHEEDASSLVRVERSVFRDNSTNALALLGVDGTEQTTVIADNIFERNHAVGQWPVAPRYGTGLTGGGQVYLARAEGVRFVNNRVVDGFCANCYWHGVLGTGVTGVEMGIPGRATVKDIEITGNTVENNDAYAVAANVSSAIDSSIRVHGNQLRGNGAPWRLNGATLGPNTVWD